MNASPAATAVPAAATVGGGPGGANLFFGGEPGIGRLFGPSMGVEASWLLPAALIGLAAGIWFTRRTARTGTVRAGLLLWGGWLLVTGAVFSFMDGTVHPYYTVALAPAIAALVGISVAELWRGREFLVPRIVLATMAAATGVWAFMLLDRTPDWLPALRWIVLAGSVVVAAILAVGVHRLGRAAVVLATAAALFGLAAPSAFAIYNVTHEHNGPGTMSGPSRDAGFGHGGPGGPGGPFGGHGPGGGEADNAALAQLLEGADSRWAAASVGSMGVSGLELKTGASLMAIGGFTGSDNSPTLAQFQSYVADHEVRYFIGSDRGGPPHGRSGACATDHSSGCSRTSPRSTSAARPSTTSANPDRPDTARPPIRRPPCFPRAGRPSPSTRGDFQPWQAAAPLLWSRRDNEEVPMSVTDEYLKNNEAYAGTFTGPLPLPPSKHVAVVACMDARLDVYRILGLGDGEAHVIRNAGGVITDDEIRSLAISQRLLGTKEIILIHHTDCGMLTFTDDEFKRAIQDETGIKPEWAAEAFPDLEEDVRQSLRRIEASPFVTKHESLRGFIFDVATGRLNEVKP